MTPNDFDRANLSIHKNKPVNEEPNQETLQWLLNYPYNVIDQFASLCFIRFIKPY